MLSKKNKKIYKKISKKIKGGAEPEKELFDPNIHMRKDECFPDLKLIEPKTCPEGATCGSGSTI